MSNTILPLVYCLGFACFAEDKPEVDVRVELRAIAAQMQASLPVTGRFVIETHHDHAEYEKLQEFARQDAEKRGLGVAFPDAAHRVEVRWSYNTNREMLHTLETSDPRSHESFYSDSKHNLIGVAKANYNIEPVGRHAGGLSPANFSHLLVSTPLSVIAEKWKVSLVEDNVETGLLKIKAHDVTEDGEFKRLSVLFDVDLNKKQIVKMQAMYDGKLMAEVNIYEYITSDAGKTFPIFASRVTYRGMEPIRFDRLLTKEVEFPETAARVEESFELFLEKGTRISDRINDRYTILHQALSVKQLFGHNDIQWIKQEQQGE